MTTSQPIMVPVHQLPHAPETLPHYATEGSAGMDVRAALDTAVTLAPFERMLVPTGLMMMLPQGYECQIRPRSGLAIKHGISLINAVGTIDSDYRDEVKVPLVNLSQIPFTLEPGERIAQLIIAPVTIAAWEPVTLETVQASKQELVESGGRSGGFGSTGRS